MEQYYKLYRIEKLANNDTEFIKALVAAFLEEMPEEARLLKIAVASKDYSFAYKTAHKIKPTIDLFELGVLDNLIEVQDWGKLEKQDIDITENLDIVLTAVKNTVEEMKVDFNL